MLFAAVCDPPCQNGGQCFLPGQCTCPPGWEGDLCEIGTVKISSDFVVEQAVDEFLCSACGQLPAIFRVKMVDSALQMEHAIVQTTGLETTVNKV